MAATFGDALSLTTILPGMVMGPALGPEVSGSLELPLRMLTGRLPFVPRLRSSGIDTRDAAELHIKALTDPRTRGERVLAAGAPLFMREQAEALKDRLGLKASRVSTREAPDWLIRAMGLVSFEARFVAAGLGKHRRYDSRLAEAVLGRPLRTLREATADAGESLVGARRG